MRLLVHAPSLSRSDRLRCAAFGLAGRGHAVAWLGDAPPAGESGDAPTLTRVRSAREAGRVDVLIGGSARPVTAAWAGWMAGAHAAVFAVDAAHPPGFTARAAWGALDAMFVIGSSDGSAPAALPDLEVDRILNWSGDAVSEPVALDHPDVDRLERACERLTARRRGLAPRPAVFLDRDGTLVIERGYLTHAADIELLPSVTGALRRLRAAGFALVVVSNQSGVGRGLFPRSRVYEAMARLRALLREHGIELDAVYFCPHRPEAGCDCRKPSPKLLRDAAEHLRLSLRDSAMVGDKLLDVATGHAAGARGILVRTGYGRDEERRIPGEFQRAPDAVVDDLEGAASWLFDDAKVGEGP